MMGAMARRPAVKKGEQHEQEPEAPLPASYTIDQLSQHTGVPGRTIRFYQSQGVLPSPRRQGRMAFYDDDHVRRLQLIAELRDKGLRLDAIRNALAELESGSDSLHHWLGLSERFSQSSWVDDRPVLLTHEELVARFGPNPRKGLLADLEGIGVVRREGAGVRPSFLVQSLPWVDNIVMLESVGIEMRMTVHAALKIQRTMVVLVDDLVGDFVSYFREDLQSGRPDRADRVVRAVEMLRPAGIDTLRIMFAEQVDRAIRELVEGGPVALEAMLARQGPLSDPVTAPDPPEAPQFGTRPRPRARRPSDQK